MKNSNSLRIRPGFKHRLHLLRSNGERTYNIGNPIVAFEDEHGGFAPRRPERGETHLDGPCFNSDAELEAFLLERERNQVDHDKLFHDEAKFGIDPYHEFATSRENSEAIIQPGSPSIGIWQRHRAFHHCVSDDILDLRSWRLLSAEFKHVCEYRYRLALARVHLTSDTEADLDFTVASLRAGRKHRWSGKRKELPPGTAQFYHDAQRWARRYAAEFERMWEEDFEPTPEPKSEPAPLDDWE